MSRDLVLSVLMLASVALGWGGIVTLRRDRTRGRLMLVAALVALANVLIWVV